MICEVLTNRFAVYIRIIAQQSYYKKEKCGKI